jgi:putative FmdB family regulatory protein
MPLYEYECERCGHRFEVIQKFSDPLVEACPVCGGPVRKLMSSPAIQFKGSGWYITDYAKKDSGKKDAGPASSDAAKSDKGDAAAKPAADTKSEPAAEKKSAKDTTTKSAKDSKTAS